jgi:hypothetical protein
MTTHTFPTPPVKITVLGSHDLFKSTWETTLIIFFTRY